MKAVAYYHVSIDKQGRSGLGLEAQQMTVEHFDHWLDAFIKFINFEEQGFAKGWVQICIHLLFLCRQ